MTTAFTRRCDDLVYDPQRKTELKAQAAKVGIDIEDGNRQDMINSTRRLINRLSERADQVLNSTDHTELEKITNAIETAGHWIAFQENKQHSENQAADMLQAMENPNHDRVKLLKPQDKFTTPEASGQRDLGYGFGDFIHGAVCGTSRPDIKNALSEGSDSAGGYSVPEILLNQIVDAMRARQIAVRAGATTVALSSDSVRMLKIASDPKPSWRAENSPVAESEPTFSAVQFSPKSLAVLVKCSRELLEDSVNINEALTLAFSAAMAEALDRAVIFGDGQNSTPLGLINQGIPEIEMASDGGEITGYGKILDLLETFQSNDNWDQPSAMVMHPRTWRAIEGLVDNEGNPMRAPESVYSIPKHISTNMPIDEKQGSATNASSILIGDWSKCLIGIRNQMRIEILRETYMGNLQYGFICHLRADAAVMHERSFARLKGIIPKAVTTAKGK
jgi:HK97 family phage major capsid protein